MNAIVTAIGSMSAECVINSLLDMGIGVVATDIYPKEYHPIAHQCLDFQQVPRVYPDELCYCKAIFDIAIKNKCAVIIPLTDPEVDVLSSNRKMFEDVGVKVCLPDDEVIKRARCKSSWCKALSAAKYVRTIPTYDTYQELCESYSGEFVAKRVRGRSSEGIILSNTMVYHDCIDSNQEYIFQPRIKGDILTVDFVKHPTSHKFIFVPRIELMRTKNGAGTVVRIAHQDFCNKAMLEMVEVLGLTGVMNCEFICSDEGLYLMDINPRFSAGVSFSKMAGYDFVKSNIDCYTSDCIDNLVNQNEGHIFVKRFCDFK